MAGLPTNVSTCIVTGRLAATEQTPATDAEPDVIPLVGTVTFKANVPHVLHESSNTIFVPKKIVATLDGSGNFTTMLVASDDPDLNPTGWTYNVSFQLVGASVAPFNFVALSGQTMEITDITPVAASTGTPSVQGDSAYEVWLGLGNVGTEQDFIDTLKVSGLIGGVYSVRGDLGTGIGTMRVYNDTGVNATIKKVRASIGTPAQGADIILDVLMDGSTIYPSSPKLTVPAGDFTAVAVPDDDVWFAGSYITVDILQVGSPGTTGADLVVSVST